MGLHEIQKCYEHICDACAKKTRQHSTERPPKWANLKLGRWVYTTCALTTVGRDETADRLLCDECAPRVMAALNGIFVEISGSDRAELR